MIADFCPFTIFSDLDFFNSIDPRLWQKYIVNVVAILLLVILVVCRVLLLALAFGEKVMVSADNVSFG